MNNEEVYEFDRTKAKLLYEDGGAITIEFDDMHSDGASYIFQKVVSARKTTFDDALSTSTSHGGNSIVAGMFGKMGGNDINYFPDKELVKIVPVHSVKCIDVVNIFPETVEVV